MVRRGLREFSPIAEDEIGFPTTDGEWEETQLPQDPEPARSSVPVFDAAPHNGSCLKLLYFSGADASLQTCAHFLFP
jgi:hypothetical protein